MTQQQPLATHSRYLHEAIVELAERLQSTLPPELDAVMVVNSGSEANDLAWRIARAGHRARRGRDRLRLPRATEATHALSPEEWRQRGRPAHVATIPAPDGYRGPYRRETTVGPAVRRHIDDAAQSSATALAAIYLDPPLPATASSRAPPPTCGSGPAG